MPIPAITPATAPGTPTSRPPGSKASRLTATIDDSQGSGVVIPLNQVDDNYVDWRMQTLDGWDSPDLDEAAENKVGADGSWDADNYYAGRMLTITGVYTAPTYEEREAAAERLEQAVPPRRLVTFRVDETTPKYVMARRTGRLQVAPVTETMGRFSIAMLAPDPRKYATTLSNASAVIGTAAGGAAIPLVLPAVFPPSDMGGAIFDVTNSGAWETPPRIRIVGPGANLGIANLTTGQSLSYAFDLAAGDELIIDVAAGSATLNGTGYRAPSPGSTVTSRFMLPKGTSRMQFLGSRTVADTSPQLTMTWRSAWM